MTKVYPNGVRANDDVTLRARSGEVVCLTGPNGAGKTTLVRQLMGLLKPTRGVVRVLGHDPLKRPDVVRREVGYVPQAPLVFLAHKVREVIDFVASTSVHPRGDVEELIEALGLSELSELVGYQLSLGQRKLLLLALALIKNPSVLVLDEPTSLVDVLNKRVVWEAIASAKREGRTVLVVSHDLEEIKRLCDEIYVMAAGRIVFRGEARKALRALGGGAEVKVYTSKPRKLETLLKGNVALESSGTLLLTYDTLGAALEDLQALARSGLADDIRVSLEYPSLESAIVSIMKG